MDQRLKLENSLFLEKEAWLEILNLFGLFHHLQNYLHSNFIN